MRVTQSDLARLSDAEVARLVLSISDAVQHVTYEPMVEFWTALAGALIRARRERRCAFAAMALEAEVEDDGEMGALLSDLLEDTREEGQ